jgi:hypothetical protein
VSGVHYSGARLRPVVLVVAGCALRLATAANKFRFLGHRRQEIFPLMVHPGQQVVMLSALKAARDVTLYFIFSCRQFILFILQQLT